MAKMSKIKFVIFIFVFWCIADAEKRTWSERIFAQKYLKQYHYLSPLKSGNHDLKTAVEMFQRFMHLPVNGKLDDVTYREMRKPRCGFPDIEEDVDTGSKTSSGNRIAKRFGVSSRPWNTTALTYKIENYSNDMTSASIESVIAKAFKMWSDNSVLTFTKVPKDSKANIAIAFGTKTHANCQFPFDGPGTVLAHANFPKDGRLHFDDDETFTDGTPDGTNLLAIAVHEIGHTIGISHSDSQLSIMYPEYKGYQVNLQLDQDDINAVAYLYGGGTVQPKVSQSVTCADLWGSCSSYNKDWCTTHADAMRKNCAATCGFCGGGQIQSPCVDKYAASFCQSYKIGGFCKFPSISSECKKTCSVC